MLDRFTSADGRVTIDINPSAFVVHIKTPEHDFRGWDLEFAPYIEPLLNICQDIESLGNKEATSVEVRYVNTLDLPNDEHALQDFVQIQVGPPNLVAAIGEFTHTATLFQESSGCVVRLNTALTQSGQEGKSRFLSEVTVTAHFDPTSQVREIMSHAGRVKALQREVFEDIYTDLSRHIFEGGDPATFSRQGSD